MARIDDIAGRINRDDISGIRDGLRDSSAFLKISAIVHSVNIEKCPDDIVELIKAAKSDTTEVAGYVVSEVATAALDIMGVETYAGENRSIIRMIESRF